MLCICTANDTTLAAGASVPTTNAGPDSEDGVDPVELVDALVQPAIKSATAARDADAIGNFMLCALNSIMSHLSDFVSVRVQ
jgi:hypothetical protein